MISSTTPSGHTPPLLPSAGGKSGPAGPALSGDTFLPGHTALLQTALSRTPAVRPEALAAAVRLAADPSYPPPDVIAQVARLIAQSPDPSEAAD